MFNWLLSRPLQIKFFVSTAFFVGIALLLMLSVSQVLNQFLTHHLEEDMQQRTHILAMTLMEGSAAHDPLSLNKLLRDVMEMHGYCYLTVQNLKGKQLASVGDAGRKDSHCFAGAIPLVHDNVRFGTLIFGVSTDFFDTLKHELRDKLLLIAAAGLLFGTALYFLLVRRLIKLLQEITRASDSLAHGNLKVAMPASRAQDELGKLAASFRNMVASLSGRIESQQRYAHAVYAEQARLNALISILPVGVMFVDPDSKVQYINLECRRLWGLPEDVDYLGRLDRDLIAYARDLLEQPDAFVQQVAIALKEYGASPPFDTKLRSGHFIRSRSCVVPDASGKRYIGRIWMFEDVSGEHARLDEAHSRAERDALTGLYNRRRFEEDIERMFAQAQRDNSRLTLLYFDLDDFKLVNDNHGHHSGDKVLKAVAQALILQARRSETLYRMGGDEFAILVADAELRQIESLAKRVVATVDKLKPDAEGNTIHVSCSMGIAVRSSDSPLESTSELMQQADIAMYQAKHSGKNLWHVFDPAHPLDLGKDSR